MTAGTWLEEEPPVHKLETVSASSVCSPDLLENMYCDNYKFTSLFPSFFNV